MCKRILSRNRPELVSTYLALRHAVDEAEVTLALNAFAYFEDLHQLHESVHETSLLVLMLPPEIEMQGIYIKILFARQNQINKKIK